MKFEEEYPISGQLRLTFVHESGMVFSITPLVGYDMAPEQKSAELKVARIKLNEAVKEWENKHMDNQRVKEALVEFKAYSKPNIDNEIFSEEVRIKIFEKRLGLDK